MEKKDGGRGIFLVSPLTSNAIHVLVHLRKDTIHVIRAFISMSMNNKLGGSSRPN